MKYKLSKDVQNLLRHNIAFYREKEGLSQYALGIRLGVDNSYISKVESGKKRVSVGFIYKFSKEFGLSLDTLFSENTDNKTLQNINAMLDDKPDKDLKLIEKVVKDILDDLEKR